jgi:NAD(P)-dependent dehydrogenase (short-subunit alcohol dehydrogenase family)
MGLLGKVAIVTGASQGVGRGIALALGKEGAATAVVARRYEKLVEVVAEIEDAGGRALAIECDVRSRDQIEKAVAATVYEFGPIDIMVHAARGDLQTLTLEEETDEHFIMEWETGPLAGFRLMQACLPHLKVTGGKVIIVASGAGVTGMERAGAYSSAKEAMRSLARVAAREWGQYRINVNCILPFGNSASLAALWEQHPELAERAIADIPLGRVGDSEVDIGRAVVFLAGPDSDYITGATIPVDGGSTMSA